MNKVLRYSLYLLGGLVLILGAAVAYILLMFDPNTVKPQIERVVGEKTQRQLKLGGDIRLRVWPTVSASVDRAQWSEYRSNQPFVQLGHIQVDLAFWPLLQRRYVVKNIEIDDLSGQVTRYADGRLSIQDLLEQPQQPQAEKQAIEFAIDKIRLRNAKFQFDDRQQKRLSVVNHLNFAADNVHKDGLEQVNLAAHLINSSPVANAVIALRSERIRFIENQPIVLEKAHFEANGAAAGYRIQSVILDASRLQADTKGGLLAEGVKATGGASGALGLIQAAALELGKAQFSPGKPVQVEALRASLRGSAKDASVRVLNINVPKGQFDPSGSGAVDGLELHAEGDYQNYRNIKLDVKTRGTGGLEGQTALRDLSVVVSTQSTHQALAANLTAPSLIYADKTIRADQVNGTISLKSPQQALATRLRLTGLNARLTQTVSIGRLWAQGNAALGKNAADFTIDSPLNVGLDPITVSAPDLKLNADIKTPTLRTGSFPLAVTGKAQANLRDESASAQLSGRFDTSGGRVDAAVNGFDRSAIKLDADLDRIDLDRYIAPAQESSASKTPAENQTAPSGANPLDLSALAPLKLKGKVSIGKITRGTLQANKLSVAFDAGNGRIAIPDLSVQAFEGQMKGSLSATTTARPAFQIKQVLSGVNIEQALDAFADLDKLEGRGNADIDVTATGANLEELKRTVNGTVTLKVADGAWKGINLAKTLRESQALVRGQLQTRQSIETEKTDFSEITATVKLTDGVAYNDDLSAKSPLLRLSGKGRILLPSDSVDYVAQVSIVNTSKGQGGKELTQLDGLTVPVRIRGPFSKLNYTLDYANMLKEATRAKLEEQKKALEAQAQQQIEAAKVEAQKRFDEEKLKAQQRLEEEKQKAKQKLESQIKKGLGDLLRPKQPPAQPPATPAQPQQQSPSPAPAQP